ncbi:MAG: TIM barrel protein [Clostridiales Family XIII bacterium]|jgi:hydroxypyruvate isomerase|nr:TIM barrel protein [Clostridiales Family XIII bacterium]
MLKRSINIEYLYAELPFLDRIAAAKADGFEYIEFWGWEGKDLPAIKAKLDETGVKFAGMSGDGPLSMCDPANKEAYIAFIKQSIEASKIIGNTRLIIHSDALQDFPHQYAVPLSGDYSYETKLYTMLDVLKTIAPLGEEAGITLEVEALNTVKDHKGVFLNNTTMNGDLVRAVGSPNVKILYDAYHMYLDEGQVFEKTTEYIDVIGYIHIADAPGRGEPGTGAINFKNYMLLLSKLGYEHIVGYELEPAVDSKTAIEAIREVSDNI